MKKKMIIFTSFFLLLIIVIISYSIIRKESKESSTQLSKELSKLMKKKKTYDTLLEINYSNSGDMNGNVDSLSLNIKEKKITTKYAVYHSDPIEIKEYSIADADIEKIINRIQKYNYPMWTSLKDSDEIAYDAAIAGISFTYDNKRIKGSSYETYYISFNKVMEKDTREELSNFVNYLQSLAKEDNKIKEYTE